MHKQESIRFDLTLSLTSLDRKRRSIAIMGGSGILAEDVYEVVLTHIRAGTHPSASDRKTSLNNQVYLHLQRCDFTIQQVNDPRSSSEHAETKLVVAATGKIVLKESEIDDLVKRYFQRTKGANAKTIHGLIIEHFAGVSEKRIQRHINSL